MKWIKQAIGYYASDCKRFEIFQHTSTGPRRKSRTWILYDHNNWAGDYDRLSEAKDSAQKRSA